MSRDDNDDLAGATMQQALFNLLQDNGTSFPRSSPGRVCGEPTCSCARAGDTTTYTTGSIASLLQSIDDQTRMHAITVKTALCDNSNFEIKEDIKDNITFNDRD